MPTATTTKQASFKIDDSGRAADIVREGRGRNRTVMVVWPCGAEFKFTKAQIDRVIEFFSKRGGRAPDEHLMVKRISPYGGVAEEDWATVKMDEPGRLYVPDEGESFDFKSFVAAYRKLFG